MGRATTGGPVVPAGGAVPADAAVPAASISSDDADPIEPARAVRRALAAAGRKAVEVDALCVAAPLAPTAEACRRLARRALGPHGSGIAVLGVAVTGDHAEDLAMAAAAFMEAADTSNEASVAEGWALAVCVGLAVDSTTVALCLGR